ncbi:hypothetical protein CAEBREN_24665 [Caenorhabditis brenneri]|uniref:Galectin n=1 Tax=Caenorhabditis brenneri TaxID=135651 RepID=G0MUA9_CAEBE|nr:hypothetical protein CAEBREN_24665 [Caenorhabditis brenneri]
MFYYRSKRHYLSGIIQSSRNFLSSALSHEYKAVEDVKHMEILENFELGTQNSNPNYGLNLRSRVQDLEFHFCFGGWATLEVEVEDNYYAITINSDWKNVYYHRMASNLVHQLSVTGNAMVQAFEIDSDSIRSNTWDDSKDDDSANGDDDL